ncbi:hypothetical protein ACJX0J_025523, partial [Zea mays]
PTQLPCLIPFCIILNIHYTFNLAMPNLPCGINLYLHLILKQHEEEAIVNKLGYASFYYRDIHHRMEAIEAFLFAAIAYVLVPMLMTKSSIIQGVPYMHAFNISWEFFIWNAGAGITTILHLSLVLSNTIGTSTIGIRALTFMQAALPNVHGLHGSSSHILSDLSIYMCFYSTHIWHNLRNDRFAMPHFVIMVNFLFDIATDSLMHVPHGINLWNLPLSWLSANSQAVRDDAGAVEGIDMNGKPVIKEGQSAKTNMDIWICHQYLELKEVMPRYHAIGVGVVQAVLLFQLTQ